MPADDSETLATSWPVAMNIAVMPFGECAPLLLAPEMKRADVGDARRGSGAVSGSTRMFWIEHVARDRRLGGHALAARAHDVDCEAFLSVAKFDSR